MPDGWRGRVFVAAAGRIAGSRAAGMQLKTSDWVELWPTIMERGFARGGENVIKYSAGGQVSRIVVPLGGKSIGLICKRSFPRGPIGKLASLLFTSRAWRSFQQARRLLEAGLNTALPLLVMHRRRTGIWRESLLVTEAVAGAVDLDRACQVELRRISGTRLYFAKAELTRSLVKLAAGLHALGLYHRDFKAPNLLVAGLTAEEQPLGVVLVDLDGLRKRGGLVGKQVWQPVMRLSASLAEHAIITRTDRMRFLQLYLRTMGLPISAAPGYWRMLEAWSRRFLKKQQATRRGKLGAYSE
jgi:hypothetical protein